MELITLRPLGTPKRSEGATAQGLRIINSVEPCVLKSNYYIGTGWLSLKVSLTVI